MSLPLPEVPEPAAEAVAPAPPAPAVEPPQPVAEAPAAARAEAPAAKPAGKPLPKRTPRATSDQRSGPDSIGARRDRTRRQQQPETPAARNGSAPLPTRPARPAAARSNEWTSPGDEGWQAAESLLNQAPDSQTSVGLPKRVPKAHLIPGSAAPKTPARGAHQGPGAPRSADSVRGRMSSFQQGVRRGRHALMTPTLVMRPIAAEQ